MFAYFTLLAYLVVGTVAVRVLAPESVELSLSTTYLSLFSKTTISESTEASIIEPSKMAFADIKFPKEVVKVAVKKTVQPKKVMKPVEEAFQVVQVAKNELPFHEPVKLAAVQFDYSLPTNLVALYQDLSIKEDVIVADASVVEDKVSTSMAASVDAEPEFFEYEKAEVVEVAKTETPKEEKTEPVSQSREDVVAEVAQDLANDELVAFDYSQADAPAKADSVAEEVHIGDLMVAEKTVKAVEPVAAPPIQGVVAFDYSKASADVAQNKIPTFTKVTTQKSLPIEEVSEKGFEKSALVAPSITSQLTIKASGMNLKSVKDLSGFEVRFQDDQSLSLEDYGTGEVKINEAIASKQMTRSITVLKRGYMPTSTDVILEDVVAGVSIPLVQEEVFNKEIEAYESRGAVGALLVELDDTTEIAKLDVPFGKVITLDGNLKKTTRDDFRYQLFIGAQAGNAYLTYVGADGVKVSKIVHIHEREVTFDANFYDDAGTQKLTLLEEDLLSKEKSPLIIGSDSVKIFATDITGKKVNDHTYKMNFGKTHLGGRQYLELTHHSEPIFVGLKENKTLSIPSERFMRYVLSNFEGGNLGNRCLVQVNLSKQVSKVDVGSESVGSNLMTYTQMLDTDGKFYESASNKTEKVVIVGENQGGATTNMDGRINIKVEYTDGSNEYLNTYCSPNSYLVEQL